MKITKRYILPASLVFIFIGVWIYKINSNDLSKNFKNSSASISIRCSSLTDKNLVTSKCLARFSNKEITISGELFFKILEFSLLSPGEYPLRELSNMMFFEKDIMKMNDENDRNLSMLKARVSKLLKLLNLINGRIDKKNWQSEFGNNLSNQLPVMVKVQNHNNLIRKLIAELKSSGDIVINDHLNAQSCIATSILVSYFDNTLPSLEFSLINDGNFIMGKTELYRGQYEVQHKVILTKEFELSKFEITQADWMKVMGYNPSYFNSDAFCADDFVIINGEKLCPKNPVESISVSEIMIFLDRLNSMDSNYQYRLPTEAQWEYASLDSSIKQVLDEDNCGDLCKHSWFYRNSEQRTHRVGTLKISSNGLYDMFGNVFEFTNDYFSQFDHSTQTDPIGGSTRPWKIIKGGGWNTAFKALHSSYRSYFHEDYKSSRIGFRVLRIKK